MSSEILICGQFNPPIIDNLEAEMKVHFVESRADLPKMDADILQRVEGFASFGWAPADIIDLMPNLKMISSYGVGYDGVDADYAASKGIMVGHTPDVLNDEVANTVIALLLATDKCIVAFDKYVRSGDWENNGPAPLTRGLAGKKVGIVGLGRIGETVAEKLAVFHCHVAYHTRTQKSHVDYPYFADLVELATDSDILIIITPGGAATNKLINEQVLNALGPQGTLINVSRGTVVDEQAMIVALQDGRLGAAGLDVFEKEPHVPQALCELENVVLAPHIGSATIETRQAMSDRVVENMVAFFNDGKPINLVPECSALLD